jgi:hypothetical protein
LIQASRTAADMSLALSISTRQNHRQHDTVRGPEDQGFFVDGDEWAEWNLIQSKLDLVELCCERHD